MLSHYTYFYFKSVLPDNFCDDIINLGLQAIEQAKLEGRTTTGVTVGNHLTKQENDTRKPLNDKTISELNVNNEDETYIRDSEISWLNNQFIYDTVFPLVEDANRRAGWHYDFDWAESCQFTKYGLNQFYGWHNDGAGDHISSYSKDKDRNKKLYGLDNTQFSDIDNFENKVRKLSVTINLTDPTKYEGGNLKFDLGPHTTKRQRYIECTEIRPRGSMIVFPSQYYHQVTPVTKGTRYSLVMWILGRPFR